MIHEDQKNTTTQLHKTQNITTINQLHQVYKGSYFRGPLLDSKCVLFKDILTTMCVCIVNRQHYYGLKRTGHIVLYWPIDIF